MSNRGLVLCGISASILVLYVLRIDRLINRPAGNSITFLSFNDSNTTQQRESSLTLSEAIADNFTVSSRYHHPRDEFTFNNVINEPPDATWNQTFADMINDYNDGHACVNQNEWIWLEKALTIWTALAKEAKVPWMLAYGTLLGYARDKYFIAYDSDVDVIVPSWSYELLNRYATVLPVDVDRLNYRGFLLLHPEFHFVPHRQRRDFWCNGTQETYYDGACGFTSPMGRLFYNHRYVDLYAADHYPDLAGDLLVYDEGALAAISPARRYFPRRPCTFAGIEAWCPYDYINVVRALYGPQISSLRPLYFCNSTTRKRISKEQSPELFRRKDDEWKNRWGLSLDASLTKDEESLRREYNRRGVAQFCSSLNTTQYNIFMSAMCRREPDE